MRRSLRTSVKSTSRQADYYIIRSDSSSNESSPAPAPVPKSNDQGKGEIAAPPGMNKSHLAVEHPGSMHGIINPSQKASVKTGVPEPARKTRLVSLNRDVQQEHVDHIEEYTFSSEEEISDEDQDLNDLRSHITLSSDGPRASENQYEIDHRPWLHMTPEQRLHYENMFVSITHPAVGQSWSYTEEYQLQIDQLLLRYMADFPLPYWVIGREAAARAYQNYDERARWRGLGIRIYGPERLPEIFHPKPTHPAQTAPRPDVVDVADRHASTLSGRVQPLRQTGAKTRQQSAASIIVAQLPVDAIGTIADCPAGYKVEQSNAQGEFVAPNTIKFKKRQSITTETPTSRPTTPPYPTRERPEFRKPAKDTGRIPARRAAEAAFFPWNRDIDFRAAQAAATWRMDSYNKETFDIMAEVRKHNEPIIERLDQEVIDKQRLSRHAKKNSLLNDDIPGSSTKPGRKKKDPNDKTDTSDPYHSGYFAFASPTEEAKARKLGYPSPEQLIAAGERDQLTPQVLTSIKLCWNPGKKGSTHDLIQAPFSTWDTVLTRKQLQNTLILTRQAAECIIDFSPDLLWRDVLLRICSEAGCGNKDVRDRFCLNGCHADKATFTKRISAALGQKQTQQKTKPYGAAEWEFYEASGEDFKDYIDFFGKRATTRNIKIGSKRGQGLAAPDSSGLEDGIQVSKKRRQNGKREVAVGKHEDVTSDDVEDEIEAESDAVSVQGSDVLDDLSD